MLNPVTWYRARQKSKADELALRCEFAYQTALMLKDQAFSAGFKGRPIPVSLEPAGMYHPALADLIREWHNQGIQRAKYAASQQARQ